MLLEFFFFFWEYTYQSTNEEAIENVFQIYTSPFTDTSKVKNNTGLKIWRILHNNCSVDICIYIYIHKTSLQVINSYKHIKNKTRLVNYFIFTSRKLNKSLGNQREPTFMQRRLMRNHEQNKHKQSSNSPW